MALLRDNISKHKGLVIFTVLNYIDKGLSFLLPLVVLYVCHDKSSYNDLEYAYSIANVIVWFFSIGSIYAFYAYKISSDREGFIDFFVFVKDTAIIAASILLILFSVIFYNAKSINLFFIINFLITARTINSFFINFFNGYSRLIDKPSRVLVYSIVINVLTILAVIGAYSLNSNLLLAFCLPQFLIPLFSSIKTLNRKRFSTFINKLKPYYKEAILFSWPLLINCFIGVGVTNFGKIFAYNFMTEEDMFIFSYTMRISLVIQLAHASIMSYYSKQVYLGDFNRKITFVYIVYLLGAAFLCLAIILGLNVVVPEFKLPINTATVIIMLYNIVFCAASFLEQFYGRINKNHYILWLSIAAAIIFIVLILFNQEKTILSIGIIMLIYAITRFIFLFVGLKRIKYEDVDSF